MLLSWAIPYLATSVSAPQWVIPPAALFGAYHVCSSSWLFTLGHLIRQFSSPTSFLHSKPMKNILPPLVKPLVHQKVKVEICISYLKCKVEQKSKERYNRTGKIAVVYVKNKSCQNRIFLFVDLRKLKATTQIAVSTRFLIYSLSPRKYEIDRVHAVILVMPR